jgi:broad specificity phosphatase PhoE
MMLAEPRGFGGSYLNDFVYGFTKKKMYKKEKWDDGESSYGTPNGIWHLRTKYYRNHHVKAWKAVTEIVESNPDKNIILMTHHCLSPKCISDDYVNDALNASYVSDKENWILAHPNVKLILSGHVHHRANFKIGETLYVLNPLGYCRDTATQFNPDTNENEMWTPNCFVDTDTWELSYEPYDNENWRELLEIQRKNLMRYAGIFL